MGGSNSGSGNTSCCEVIRSRWPCDVKIVCSWNVMALIGEDDAAMCSRTILTSSNGGDIIEEIQLEQVACPMGCFLSLRGLADHLRLANFYSAGLPKHYSRPANIAFSALTIVSLGLLESFCIVILTSGSKDSGSMPYVWLLRPSQAIHHLPESTANSGIMVLL